MVLQIFFNSNIDFECVGTHKDYEEQLNFLEAWLATPCLDEVCVEFGTMTL